MRLCRLLLLLIPLGCADTTGGSDEGTTGDSGSGVTCTDDSGDAHAVDETWTTADGCNTCTCLDDGTADCTDLACP